MGGHLVGRLVKVAACDVKAVRSADKRPQPHIYVGLQEGRFTDATVDGRVRDWAEDTRTRNILAQLLDFYLNWWSRGGSNS